jgi:hypothetical protein
MRIFFTCFLIFSLINSTISAQLLTDEPTRDKIVAGLDALYNLDFVTAEGSFNKIPAAYANHPVKDLLKAFTLQWKHLPIEQNSSVLNQYIKHLESCQRKAEELAKQPKYKAEATFFLLAAHGYIALSYNYRKEYTKAVMDAGHAYGYLKDGFGFLNENIEFNFTTGVYNYYRIQYPETHPIIKPFIVFFQSGNKAKGVSQLKKAADSAIFSRIESTTYLTNIYLKYEADFPRALTYAQRLGKRYPRNYIFGLKYTEALLLNGRFEQANQQIKNLSRRNDNITALSINFFEGYYAENYLKNDDWAAQNYAAALSSAPNSRYTQEYYAMACLGMGRIMKRAGNKSKANYFLKKCLDNAEYSWVISEAKSILQ